MNSTLTFVYDKTQNYPLLQTFSPHVTMSVDFQWIDDVMIIML